MLICSYMHGTAGVRRPLFLCHPSQTFSKNSLIHIQHNNYIIVSIYMGEGMTSDKHFVYIMLLPIASTKNVILFQ